MDISDENCNGSTFDTMSVSKPNGHDSLMASHPRPSRATPASTRRSKHAASALPQTRKACESCRQKKVRCEGGRPSCTECIARQLVCIYSVQQRRNNHQQRKTPAWTPSPNHMQTMRVMEQRLLELELKLNQVAPENQNGLAPTSMNPAFAMSHQPSLLQPSHSRSPSATQHSASPSISTDQSTLSDHSLFQDSTTQPQQLQECASSYLQSHPIPSIPDASSVDDLPRFSFEVYTILHQHICSAFPLLTVDNPYISLNSPFILNAAHAVTARYTTRPRRGAPLYHKGKAYFERAINMMGDVLLEGPSYTNILGMLLLSWWCVGIGWCDKAWLCTNNAVSMAHLLGLHNEVRYPSNVSPLEQQLRRTIWWILYECDREGAISNRMPFSIQESSPKLVPYPADLSFITANRESQESEWEMGIKRKDNSFLLSKPTMTKSSPCLSMGEKAADSEPVLVAIYDEHQNKTFALPDTFFGNIDRLSELLHITTRLHKLCIFEAELDPLNSSINILNKISADRHEIHNDLHSWLAQLPKLLQHPHSIYFPQPKLLFRQTWRDAYILALYHSSLIELHLPNLARMADLGLHSVVCSDPIFSICVDSALVVERIVTTMLVHNRYGLYMPPGFHCTILPAAKLIWIVARVGYKPHEAHLHYQAGLHTQSGIDTIHEKFIQFIENCLVYWCVLHKHLDMLRMLRRTFTPLLTAPIYNGECGSKSIESTFQNVASLSHHTYTKTTGSGCVSLGLRNVDDGDKIGADLAQPFDLQPTAEKLFGFDPF
ncbi:hypothetical protein QVD99_001434 [Batrachochytrium dendrobatidis]|nr:hypothetical protein O5D80_005903 [Batrachochytrium dendrobatidis]KAK5671588.1 hypothetical protein QVD99_001434 [Batrachochytrium dendrobatidis]